MSSPITPVLDHLLRKLPCWRRVLLNRYKDVLALREAHARRERVAAAYARPFRCDWCGKIVTHPHACRVNLKELRDKANRLSDVEEQLEAIQGEVDRCHAYLTRTGAATANRAGVAFTLLGRIQAVLTGIGQDLAVCSWCGSKTKWSEDHQRMLCSNPCCDTHKER